ncbi:Calcineurin-like phosphoesterase [Flavobacteriaceae bacterium MAR_2010_188]|nr:Calcineurin-like phosphoesterase [Flavobacteriaceae bacterium MAR_2010_188]
MIKYIYFLLSFLIVTVTIQAQEKVDDLGSTESETDSISKSDGPYILIEGNRLIEKSIYDGEVVTKDLPANAFPLKFEKKKSSYNNVSKVAALSDIHGQYDLFVEILKNNQIVTDSLEWNFGNGNLVIVGDVFDRGAKVNEVLWLIYDLEKQAAAKGGAVHYILGNHEYMILEGEMGYINPKYRTTMRLLQMNYKDLYGPNTVMGRWLRSKSTILKINGITYVHGGISKNLLKEGYKMDKINNVMVQAIDKPDSLKTHKNTKVFFENDGPIWYRGYFYDNLPDEEISEILSKTKSNHIIVGHCSNEEIIKLYDGKIYGVDSSIKNGEYGEILFINSEDFTRGTKTGEKKDFNVVAKAVENE